MGRILTTSKLHIEFLILFILLFGQNWTNAFGSFPGFTEVKDHGIVLNERGESANWGDYDNDGLVDLYICLDRSRPNKLYKNLGNFQFKDETQKAKASHADYSLFAWWLDVDNDGFLDLFVVNREYDNRLYRNEGDGTFSEWFTETKLSKGHPAWCDLDCDGLLDVYMARGKTGYLNPETKKNRLFLNQGKLKFKDISQKSNLFDENENNWPNWHDFNGDNHPDLFVSNMPEKKSVRYRNNLDLTFNKPGVISINLPGDNQIIDLDNDGDPDWVEFECQGGLFNFWQNNNGKAVKKNPSIYFLPPPSNELNHSEEDFHFEEDFYFVDIDNDGFLDLQLHIHNGNKENVHRTHFFLNRNGFEFTKVRQPFALDEDAPLYSISWADVDNDGDQDCLCLFRSKEKLEKHVRLFRNESSNNYLKVILKGTDGNLDGVGAKIEVTTPEQVITRWVGIGTNYRWSIKNQLIFGLGKSTIVNKVQVHWPSGIVMDTLNLSADQEVVFTEPNTHWFTDNSSLVQLGYDTAKTVGGACTDYDNDGDIDLYVNNHIEHSCLYQNQSNGIFNNVSHSTDIFISNLQMGSLFIDYNNDNFKDLFLIQGNEKNTAILMKNQENGKFTDVSEETGMSGELGIVFSAITADFNNDGLLDIYLGLDGNNRLYINSEGERFTLKMEKSRTDNNYIAHGMVAFDYNNDGNIDIYITNSRGAAKNYLEKQWPNALYHNNGDTTFTNVTDSAGVACSLNSKGVCSGDYDNDGDFDLYVANDAAPNVLFRNNGNGKFDDVTEHAGVAEPPSAHGCQFCDFNNDGHLDLYVSGSTYIPEQHELSCNAEPPNVLYRNNGDGTFTDITKYSGIENNLEQTPQIILADFDNDGYVDVVAGNAMARGEKWAPNNYFHNRCRGNNWVKIKLEGNSSNSAGIGARINCVAGNLSMWREVSMGAGYGSSRSEIVTFGLGKQRQIDKLEITWPSGITQNLKKQPINKLLTIDEPYDLFGILVSKEAFTYSGIGFLILLGSAFLVWCFWFFIPVIRKGLQVRKQEIAEIRQEHDYKKEPPILEVSIDMLPFKGDFIFTHHVRPGNTALFNAKNFKWGRQEQTLFYLKNDKLVALNYHIKKLLDEHQRYIHDPTNSELELTENLKDIGKRIYEFLGMRGFFNSLFNNTEMKHLHINFITDPFRIPWYLAYDESSDQFLCERFSYSFSCSLAHSHALNRFRPVNYYKPASEKFTILLFGPWKGHAKELKKVESEVKGLSSFLESRKLDFQTIDTNSDEFIAALQKANTQEKELRIVHYAGHVEHNLLALGPDDYFDPAHLKSTYGISLDSRPIVFLNGCQSSYLGESEDVLVQNFLDAGASTCIVTHAKIPEITAEKFGALFYRFFIGEEMTVAEALRQSRVAIFKDKKLDPGNEITPYLYNIFGDPLTRF